MSKQSTKKTHKKLVGPVRATREGFGYVELVDHDDHESISLGKEDMQCVFPGDVVEVRAGKAGRGGRVQGQIVEVLERNTHELVGLFSSEDGLSYVKPSNSRISHDIHIPKQATAGAKNGQIVAIEIIEQPDQTYPASGQVKEILGDELAAGMEIQVALRSFDIPHEWPEAVEDQADRLGSSVASEDKQYRLDLRDMPFVTIDGEDARDFDDAVFAEKHKDGWRLWVAIADVSHYVKPGSALDTEAQQRGTSVYFPNFVVPMLPEVLSNGLCSLKPKVDRLALVCEMNISAKGRVTDFRFAEALICSHERLTYTRVARALDERKPDYEPEPDQLSERQKLGVALCEPIDQLYALYQVLYGARQRRGAMEFESVEVRFEFNDNRKIEKIVPVHRNDAHKLIEECMLCANICAAEFLEKNEIPGLYRVHMPPANEKLAALREYLGELGLSLGGGEQPAPADFKKLTDTMGDRPDKALIQTMMLRSQQQAVYQAENKGHFGLAYEAYAHFTSPIRRYPDLMVHRAIRSIVRSGADAPHVRRVKGASTQAAKKNYPYDLELVEGLGQSCSMTERRAEEATRDVVQWLKCEYLQKHLGDSFMGVISTVTHFGLFVQIIDLYVEGLIHITNLPQDYYEYDSVNQQLIGQSSRRTFKIGDKAMVQVARVDLDERKIDLALTDSSEDPDTSNDKAIGNKAKSDVRSADSNSGNERVAGVRKSRSVANRRSSNDKQSSSKSSSGDNSKKTGASNSRKTASSGASKNESPVSKKAASNRKSRHSDTKKKPRRGK